MAISSSGREGVLCSLRGIEQDEKYTGSALRGLLFRNETNTKKPQHSAVVFCIRLI